MFVRHDEHRWQIQLMEIPKAIGAGYTPVFHAHTAQVAVRFVELLENSRLRSKPTVPKDRDVSSGSIAPTANGN